MNRIKQLRQERKLSIDQLSKELKESGVSISPASISKYEREVRNPKIENWNALANFFNVSVSYITGVTDNPNNDSGRLKSIRNAKGLSYQQLADAYNKEADNFSVFNHVEKHITAQTIENIENGNYRPTKREWQLLAYALNVPQFYLAGHSNDKTGWQEWAEATGYSVEQLQNEVKRLIDTKRLDANADKQRQINYAVQSLDCQVPTTTSGVINGVQEKIHDLLNYVDDAFLITETTQSASKSKYEIIHNSPNDTHVRKDMDKATYKQIVDILNETNLKLIQVANNHIYDQPGDDQANKKG